MLVRLLEAAMRYVVVLAVYGSLRVGVSGSLELVINVVFWCYTLSRPWVIFTAWWGVHYSLSDVEVRLRRGLLIRHDVRVAWDEVVAVHVSRPMLHRTVGCAVVTVGIGSGPGRELRLDGVSEEDAQMVVEAYQRFGGRLSRGVVPPSPSRSSSAVVYRAQLQDYLLISVTYGQFVVVVPMVLSGYLELSRWLPLPRLERPGWVSDPGSWTQVVLVVVIAVAGSVGLGAVLAWLRYRNFSTVADEQYLRITGGAVSQEDRRIPHDAVEGLKLEQNPLMRLSGRARLSVVTKQGGARMSSNMVVPVASLPSLTMLTDSCFPGFAWNERLPGRRLALLEGAALLLAATGTGGAMVAALRLPSGGFGAALLALATGLAIVNLLWCSVRCTSSGLIVYRRGLLWTTAYVLRAQDIHVSQWRAGKLSDVTGRVGVAVSFLERGQRTAQLVAMPRADLADLRRLLLPPMPD